MRTGEQGVLVMTAPQQGAGVLELCKEGDELLGAGELDRATAIYTSAFGRHAGSTVSHMRGLGVARLAGVICTLEAWLDGHGETRGSAEGLNKGLAAVFLSTLSPNNLSASLYKMESVLLGAGQGCEEVAVRCSALLEGTHVPRAEGSTRLALELTRALACLLSEPHSPKGPQLFLKAFRESESETVRLVKSRQAQHLPRIVKAFLQHLAKQTPALRPENGARERVREDGREEPLSAPDCIAFLVSVSPGDTRMQELQAAMLLHSGRFEESAEAFSLALQGREAQAATPSGMAKVPPHSLSPERKACLLVGRAAANFSAGGKAAEACLDLGEAFGTHPATARQQFQRLFCDNGTGQAAQTQLRQQAERGLSGYREAVLVRPDLRSSEGVELLDPVIAELRALCHLEPGGGGRELRVRLADCLLLRGEFREALSICSQLAAATSPARQSYQNTVQVLRGYARLLSDDHQGAAEDFQAVIEHSAPHPSSCVRALCGRGLLRMLAGSPYLTALDYMTASRLQPQDTALTVRCLVPWNQRGLLCTVLLEQGRAMLEGPQNLGPTSSHPLHQEHQQSEQPHLTQGREGCPTSKEGPMVGVHALSALLVELEPGVDGPQILAADALYRLGRVEEAYRLLLSIGNTSARSPILARLALLQLHRGFLYDANQLLKKLTQCGDTSCLSPLLAVASQEDRALLQKHCHKAASRILESQREEPSVREAVAYLSIAIMASGGEATESLLARARCYALLGQRKTAIFDFSTILKEHSEHVQALCGRGFMHLMLNQQKDKGRKLICDWLQHYCRASLSEVMAANPVPCKEEHLKEAFLISGALMKTDSRDPRWHLLYIDTLLAKGEVKGAGAHLGKIFGKEPREAAAQARWGVVESWQQNFGAAAKGLSKMAERDPSTLDFLLTLIGTANGKPLAQAAAQEASYVSERGQWEPALALLTVAVRAVGEAKPQYLRQRAACLARLGIHDRAVSDLDRVVRGHGRSAGGGEEPGVQAEDLCRRGRSLVLCSREEPALEDFARALELHPTQALHCVETGLGRSRLAECFLRGALQQYGEQRMSQAWRLAECGLRVDPGHAELRRLRARIKREFTGSCIMH
ncbi:hypothetical protein JZ751_008385 [Albula glossodonta]|uniref:Tetratricopeptide repeat domain 34 n=1 Tax=Albula glossodonta TaxID=121402 RepID=A0A8T2N8W9_9TELE|nr:hypothetical protein JZ751_008385 [Albula glossodonta]